MQFGWLTLSSWGGLYALIALPLIVLIHFLQRKKSHHTTTTLFLLKRLELEEVKGSQLSYLPLNRVLLLQLLTAAAITLLLFNPQRARTGLVNRVVLVVDSSVSMRPFKGALIAELRNALTELKHPSLPTEWIVLESGGRQRLLYTGTNSANLMHSLEEWEPTHSHHSLLPAINQGLRYSGPNGSPVLLSDREHPETLPYDTITAGKNIANVGFTGIVSYKDQWSVSLKNHSELPQQRILTITHPDGTETTNTIQLAPQQLMILTDTFASANADTRIELHLDGDQFPLDDYIPVLPTIQPPLQIFSLLPESLHSWRNRLVALSTPVTLVNEPSQSDLVLMEVTPVELPTIKQSGILLLEGNEHGFLSYRSLFSESSPLLDSLHFHGIASQNKASETLPIAAQPILFSKNGPVLWERKSPKLHQLILSSNMTSPETLTSQTMAVVFFRFFAELRSHLHRYRTGTSETRQRLVLPAHQSYKLTHSMYGRASVSKTGSNGQLFTPFEPGFVQLRLDGDNYATYANYFADIQEADFRKAKTLTRLTGHLHSSTQLQSIGIDWNYLLLGIMGALIYIWYLQGLKHNRADQRKAVHTTLRRT